jgi:hypothetical protein
MVVDYGHMICKENNRKRTKPFRIVAVVVVGY